MPEPFKNNFNPEMIALMGKHLKKAWGDFDEGSFVAKATKNLEMLELKQRSDQIMRALESCLPKSLPAAAEILLGSLHPEDDIDLSGTSMDDRGIRGWAILPMTDYVGAHGLADFDLGMQVQKEMTKRFTAELGIRQFFIADQQRALDIVARWIDDPNYHVRRLVSEGSRPRLPWAVRLPALVENPDPLLPLLERLKDDPSEYVRRSVANSLNDIAKDHPDKVAATAGRWLRDASPEREKLVRHACRSLVKQGHAATLAALGYGEPEVALESLEVHTPVVQFGGELRFEVCLSSQAAKDQNLIVDYAIHHRKANGGSTAKVFKWKILRLRGGAAHKAEKIHRIRPITTRVYYAGTHRVEIKVNGKSLGVADFELVMPET